MSPSIVVACAENRVIGRDGILPWKLPDDLRRFRRLTLGHAILMGRRTWESIGRPLPGRRNLVVTRGPIRAAGIETHESLATALAAVAGEPEPFVIGGERLYGAALPQATRIHRTRIHAEIVGDAFFPQVEWSAWRLVFQEHHPADERHAYAFSFETWERRG